jgi:anti-sigma B factor antagonist
MPGMANPPDDFAISSEDREGRIYVSLRGELDLATAPELEELVNERVDARQEVVVDLRGLEFMDSSGIRVLVAAHARAGRTGTRVVVVRPEPNSAVAKIVEVSGLDGELNLVDDPAQAA